MLYGELSDGRVQCHLCHRRCVIPKGSVGFCHVRRNVDGKLYSLVYAKAVAANIDPIEKKPLYHYRPGSAVMSIATVSCNFRCQFCDNWVLSQEKEVMGRTLPPESVVELSIKNGCDGVSYTYTEPTVFFEYAYDTAKLAKQKGLFNTFVTNGYMTPEAVEVIAPYLDAATVDFKGSGNPEFYRRLMSVPSPEPIFDTLRAMKQRGIFVEITDLIVTKYGDSLEDVYTLASRVKEVLGGETPFHVLRFHPDYELVDVPSTPIDTLEKAAEKAMEAGLKHVYVGNVPGHHLENTYCPSCNALIIERHGFYIISSNLKDTQCPSCGRSLNIVGPVSRKRRALWLSFM
ncbi:MAG: AmmeMemoRadiSam system radical SAM enzyme [Candidatus Nezhaarchaeota archaeon]|nr:AmmeMemoRadiSam system radical SAM enzyme [Candidatus Nezhaarchaeota archaeon]